MIFDSHVHVYPAKIAERATEAIGEFYDVKMDGNGSLATMLQNGEEAGISKFLIHSVATTAKQVESINNFIVRTVEEHGDKFIGFGTLHPDLEDPKAEVDRMISIGLKGVKLHPDFQKFAADSDAAMRLYEAIDGRLPVLFHAGDPRYDFSHPSMIAHVIDAFPTMPVIAAHMGGWNEWEKVKEAYQGRTVWVDTSSTRYWLNDDVKFRDLLEFFGEEHVLFGTDYPMWHAEEELEWIRSFKLPKETEEKIFSKNLQKLLNL